MPPPAPQRVETDATASSHRLAAFDVDFFTRALPARPGFSVVAATPLGRGSAESILSELTAWRSLTPTGLFRYALDLDEWGVRRRRDVVLKVKARDADAIAVGEALSGLFDNRIGDAYARWSERLGLSRSHVRELAIYTETDERFTSHAPALLGSVRDDRAGLWALVLEHLTDAVLLDTVNAPQSWTPETIAAAIAGLSRLQAIWYGRGAELARPPWIGWIQTAASAVEMTDLWDRAGKSRTVVLLRVGRTVDVDHPSRADCSDVAVVATPRIANLDADPQRLQPAQRVSASDRRRLHAVRVRLGAGNRRRPSAGPCRVPLLRARRRHARRIRSIAGSSSIEPHSRRRPALGSIRSRGAPGLRLRCTTSSSAA